MKIDPARSANTPSSSRRAPAAGGAGFMVPGEASARAAAVSGPGPVSGLDGVLALQMEGFDPARRGRQARRGRLTLDALEALSLAQLGEGGADAARLSLTRLQAETEPTGDPGLDQVLGEIDVRAAVELAKLDMARLAMTRNEAAAP